MKHVLVTGGNGQLGTELKRYAWPEGWAVTAIDIVVTGAMTFEGPQFRADHPFLFVLRDRPTGAMLFIGRVADPTAR